MTNQVGNWDKYSASREQTQINLQFAEAQPIFNERSEVKGIEFASEKQTSGAKIVVEAAGGAVVAADGLVLLMMRRGMWDLPKGHREEGESFRECALREVCEECGLDPASLTVGEEIVRTVHTYYYKPLGRWDEKHTVWFRMDYSGDMRDIAPQAEEDITALEWMTLPDAIRAAATSYKTIHEVIEKLRVEN